MSLLLNVVIVANQGNSYNSMVTYTCKYGYQFVIAGDNNLDPTSSIRKTVRCKEDGRWGPDLADCKRTYNLRLTLKVSAATHSIGYVLHCIMQLTSIQLASHCARLIYYQQLGCSEFHIRPNL